jgi:ParB family transcriptional regulator, chromosome partitioning protein
MNHEVKVVPIEAIEIEDGFNPRQQVDDELADSIRRHGVLQPVLVRPKPDSDERWLLVDGQRRITAARKEGHTEIPVSVRADLDNNGLAAALVTALKRKDLDPVDLSGIASVATFAGAGV